MTFSDPADHDGVAQGDRLNQGRRLPEYARVDLARALTSPPLAGLTGLQRYPAGGPLFGSPVPVPPMPWKLTPARGHISGNAVMTDGRSADQVAVGVYDRGGTLVASRRTDGSGWIGFVDVPPGEYTLRAEGTGGARASAPVTVVAGRVAPVAFVLER